MIYMWRLPKWAIYIESVLPHEFRRSFFSIWNSRILNWAKTSPAEKCRVSTSEASVTTWRIRIFTPRKALITPWHYIFHGETFNLWGKGELTTSVIRYVDGASIVVDSNAPLHKLTLLLLIASSTSIALALSTRRYSAIKSTCYRPRDVSGELSP
jgi:hypothetical protein